MGCPRIPCCPLVPVARCLALAFEPHPPPLHLAVPPLCLKSRPLQKPFPSLDAPVSFVRWPCGLLRGPGLGRNPPSLPILSAVRVGSDALGPGVNRSSETRLSPRPPERTLRTGLEGWDSGWQLQLPVLSGTQLCGLVYKSPIYSLQSLGKCRLGDWR